MATVGSSRAMELGDCDVLKGGKLAGLIVMDVNTPNMQPMNDIYSNLVYSGNSSNIKLTMINGVIWYTDGNYYIIEDDLDELYRRVNIAVSQLK